MPAAKKIKTGTRVNFLLIPEQDGQGKIPEPYQILQEVRKLHHGDTLQARIAMAWRLRTKADQDGHIVLGKCVKVSDLQREFADYDFIIVLNKEFWEEPTVTKAQRIALVDHEMMHCAPTYNGETGEHEVDERGRYLFRTRSHDVGEFIDIIRRNGIWKHDLLEFAKVLQEKKKAPMFAVDPDAQAAAQDATSIQ